jgi:hypothetical protein
MGDNGPTAWPRYCEEGVEPPGSTGGLRWRKHRKSHSTRRNLRAPAREVLALGGYS